LEKAGVDVWLKAAGAAARMAMAVASFRFMFGSLIVIGAAGCGGAIG
jgi:hypothetical protein